MAETLNEAYKKIMSDNDTLSRFRAIKSDEELVKFAESLGVKATADEIKAFIAGKKDAELSDDELEQVAGGKDDDEDDSSKITCPKCHSANVSRLMEFGVDYFCGACGNIFTVGSADF